MAKTTKEDVAVIVSRIEATLVTHPEEERSAVFESILDMLTGKEHGNYWHSPLSRTDVDRVRKASANW